MAAKRSGSRKAALGLRHLVAAWGRSYSAIKKPRTQTGPQILYQWRSGRD